MLQESIALMKNPPILEELRQVPWIHLRQDTIEEATPEIRWSAEKMKIVWQEKGNGKTPEEFSERNLTVAEKVRTPRGL